MGLSKVEIYSDAAVYIFTRHDLRIIHPVFVNDMTFASKSLDVIREMIEQLQKTSQDP